MPQIKQILSDRYELQRTLGLNASRQTWLATDLNTQEPVVVKLLAMSPQMQWDESQMFEREAQVLQRLNHPRIPQYRDYFSVDRLPDSRFPWFGLVQSYIAGESLQQLLERGQHFGAAQVEKIAVEVLTILTYLHEFNPPMLHRDIKPSNLIWGKDERVYLVDFGSVQERAALEGATFTVVGTYGYVPMEQFGGRAVPASDLYALGATLIHLLTGTAPSDLPQQDSRLQFADRVSLERGFVNWIGKLVEPNLAERLSNAREALDALDNRHTLSLPIANCKPAGSQIQLKKSAVQLEIIIPPRNSQALKTAYLLAVSDSVVSTFGWALRLSFVPVAWLFTTLDKGVFWVVELLLIPFAWHILVLSACLCAFVLVCFSICLPLIAIFLLHLIMCSAFEQTVLQFDCGSFEIRQKLFGICYRRYRHETSRIDRVAEQKTTGLAGAKGITLEAGKRRFTTNPISAVERRWLIQEIENWLGLKDGQLT